MWSRRTEGVAARVTVASPAKQAALLPAIVTRNLFNIKRLQPTHQIYPIVYDGFLAQPLINGAIL